MLKLWQKGYLQITREGSQIITWLNPSTSKLSKKAHAFSSSKWSERTAKYVSLILELSNEQFGHIVAESVEMIVTNHSAEEDTDDMHVEVILSK